MLKVSFEAPKVGVSQEVKNLFKKKERVKKDQQLKLWTHKERVLVGLILAATLLFSAYFWYKGQGRLPSFSVGGIGDFGFGQKVMLDK